MPSLAPISFCFASLLAVGGPLAVMLKAQSRVKETQRPAEQQAMDGYALNGFPYLKVPAGKLRTHRPVVAYQELVRQQTEDLGSTHADTLISRNNLANALLANGQYDDAEAVQRALLHDMMHTLPAEHPDTFRCQFNLALNLRMQGKLEAAREEMETVYAGCLKSLGETHPRTQEAMLVLENLRSPATVIGE